MSNSSRMSVSGCWSPFERGDGALLREGAGIRRAVALDGVDRLGDRFRRAEVTEPPAGHRVGFGEAVDRDRQIVGSLESDAMLTCFASS